MGTVNINGSNYTVLGTLAAADDYHNGGFSPAATAWQTMVDNGEDDKRGRLLVAATRYIDRKSWNEDADTHAERDAITAFQSAAYELAALFNLDPTIQLAASSGSNVKRLTAGPVEVEYFSATDTSDRATILPQVVMDFVGSYLSSNVELVRSTVSGDSDESHFDDCGDVYSYRRTDPF